MSEKLYITRFSLVLVFSVIVILISIQTAAAASVSVQTDQSYYYKGDSIQISGIVDTITNGTLSYEVSDSNSDLVVDGSTEINPDSSFSFSLDTSGGAWSGDGMFTIDVSYEESAGSAGGSNAKNNDNSHGHIGIGRL